MIVLSADSLKIAPSPQNGSRVDQLKRRLQIYRGGFEIPCASVSKTSLGRLLQVMFDLLREPTIYISDWELWSPNQYLDLFNSYRRGKGVLVSLDEAPVHQFESADEESFLSIVCLVLFYQWDAEIFDRDDRCLVTISHDEWLDVRTDDSRVQRLSDQAIGEGLLKELRG